MPTFPFTPDETQDDFFAEVPCPLCQADLVLHLPDPVTPDLLLGTCEGCKSWYLLDATRGVMALLPVQELFRQA
jgi:hypothetical protein